MTKDQLKMLFPKKKSKIEELEGGWKIDAGTASEHVQPRDYGSSSKRMEKNDTEKETYDLVDYYYKTPTTREFPRIPNDTILGLGVKLPNFRDGFRSALRLEWNYWTRPIPSSKRLGVSYELRFPFLASLYSGFRGGNFTGGVGLRFRGVELDFGSFTELWGNGPQLVERRAWMMELRSVF
jgi:hypothetical protein